jgi:hypothetical protein
MGTIRLGALLGRNQSFEAFADGPQGWVRESDQASFFRVDSVTVVHSSPYGLQAVVDSTGGAAGVLRYDYGTAGDAHALWFPAVTTHTLHGTLWARAADAASSGGLRWRLGGAVEALSAPIAHGAALAAYGLETVVASAAGLPTAGLVRVSAAMAPATVFVDDVLTVVDALALHPEWSLEERAHLERSVHRTQEGRLHGYTWHRHAAFRVPLRWLSGLEAERVNWWWEVQAPLAFTLDSSDAERVVPCLLVNDTQPVGRRIRPLADAWQGTLELAGLHDGRLAF